MRKRKTCSKNKTKNRTKKIGGSNSCPNLYGERSEKIVSSLNNLIKSAPQLLNPSLFQSPLGVSVSQIPFKNLVFKSLTGMSITLYDIFSIDLLNLTFEDYENIYLVGNIVNALKNYIVMNDNYRHVENLDQRFNGRDNWEVRIIDQTGTAVNTMSSLSGFPENTIFYFITSEIQERINQRRIMEEHRIARENEDPNREARIAVDPQIQAMRGRAGGVAGRQPPRRRRRR